MKFEDLTPEQQVKAKACKTIEDMLALAKEEGYELSDEQLQALSGGSNWSFCNDDSDFDRSSEMYGFDCFIGKSEAATIAWKFDEIGEVSNILMKNDERGSGKVYKRLSDVSMMSQMIGPLDVDRVLFSCCVGGADFEVSISLDGNGVDVFYDGRIRPYDFELMMRELERQFKERG